MRKELFGRGLFRLHDDEVKAFYTAFDDMLTRVNTNRCAAIARGEIQSAEMRIANTYIPAKRIYGFLDARIAAILAASEDAPIPPIDKEVVTQARQQFFANLGPESQRRYERLDQAQGKLSDDDHCWLARATFGSVATLAEPYASMWARTLAASMAANSTDESSSGQATEN